MIQTALIKENLQNGRYRNLFLDIYVDKNVLDYQTDRYIKAVEKFETLYGEGEVQIFSAPGRSEVCGNHTDHQQGQILAASINLDAIAVVKKTDENEIRLVSDGFEEIVIDITKLEKIPEEEGTTKALVKGILKTLTDNNYLIGGFNAYITSDVLIGAGLSSSAAFEIVTGTIISYLYNQGKIDAVTLAMAGQYAENVYFGKPCGLMDQMACSVGSLVHVDFEDLNLPKVEKIDFDMNRYGYSLCITDTKGSHANLTDDYAAVPREMKAVAACFGQKVLLGIESDDIISRLNELREKCGDRAVLRAIHFVEENERVKRIVEVLEKEDIDGFLQLVKASGNSSFKYLQNVYTNEDIDHQNISVALAVSEICLSGGSGVARIHGGGFAGTIQAFVKDEKVASYQETMDSIFGEGSCSILKIRKYGGMKVI